MSNENCPQCGGRIVENTAGQQSLSAGTIMDSQQDWLECLDCGWREGTMADPLRDVADAKLCAAFGMAL